MTFITTPESKYDPDMPCNKKGCDASTRASCCGCKEMLEYERRKRSTSEREKEDNMGEEPKTIEEKIELTLSLNETELKKEALNRITAIVSDELRQVLYKETFGYYGTRDYVPKKATEDIIRSWLDEHQDLVIEAVVDKVTSKLTHSNPIRERIAQLAASKILTENDDSADQSGLASAT